MKYQDAIEWLVLYDDCGWCDPTKNSQYEHDPMSVTASFVADAWGKDDDQIRRDVQNSLRKRNGDSYVETRRLRTTA